MPTLLMLSVFMTTVELHMIFPTRLKLFIPNGAMSIITPAAGMHCHFPAPATRL